MTKKHKKRCLKCKKNLSEHQICYFKTKIVCPKCYKILKIQNKKEVLPRKGYVSWVKTEKERIKQNAKDLDVLAIISLLEEKVAQNGVSAPKKRVGGKI